MRKPTRREVLTGLAITLPQGSWPGIASAATSPDPFETVLQRLRADYLVQVSTRGSKTFLAKQAPSGLWGDVNYADQSVGYWNPVQHLERLRAIAVSTQTPSDPLYDASTAKRAVIDGLRAWLRRRPSSENWWHNTIGAQLALMPILVLLKDELPDEVMAASINLLTMPRNVQPDRVTGQNLTWYATQQIVRGALLRNTDDLQQASAAMQKTLLITTDEGIQPDLSFHQHGPQLYSGGYGLEFLKDNARVATWLAGTPWAFAPERLETLADFATQGIMPLIRGSWLDWGAMGRAFTRKAFATQTLKLLLPAMKALAATTASRQAQLQQAIRRLEAPAPQLAQPYNRAFWRSDFIAHQTARGYFSVKVTSKRNYGTESGNGENLLGYWLPFGVSYIVRRDSEYEGLQALWDWSALPGLTAPAEVPPLKGYQHGHAVFAGVLSDGSWGLATLQLKLQQTQAKRSWFLFEDMLVALGSDISSEHPKAVRTTLNQTRWLGDVHTDQGKISSNIGASTHTDLRWVWHDGVTYLLLDAEGNRLQFAQKQQPGKDPSNPAFGTESAAAPVLTLGIDHGIKPAGAHYAYAVSFAASRPAEVAGIAAPVILANSTAVQAVSLDSAKRLAAVFHAAGSLSLGNGRSLTADKPCMLMAKADGSTWQLLVDDPTGSGATVRLEMLDNGASLGAVQVRCLATAARTLQTPYASAKLPR